jgi:hypothetical protein
MFNPGPPSTSRKKRSQIGARGLPRKRSARISWQDTETRLKKFKAKRRARKAIGARGVKTNARRTRKPVYAIPVEVHDEPLLP